MAGMIVQLGDGGGSEPFPIGDRLIPLIREGALEKEA